MVDNKDDLMVNHPITLWVSENNSSVEAVTVTKLERASLEKTFKDDDSTLYIDYDAFEAPLMIRGKHQGDRIFLKRIGGHKKLKKYFMELKIPASERDQLLLIVSGDKVIWIPHFIKSNSFSVNERTKNVLRIEVKSKSI
jgi:tRNA(Ile)-lysidine synthase